MPDLPERLRQWRDYRTATGNRPVKEYVDSLPAYDKAEIVAAAKGGNLLLLRPGARATVVVS